MPQKTNWKKKQQKKNTDNNKNELQSSCHRFETRVNTVKEKFWRNCLQVSRKRRKKRAALVTEKMPKLGNSYNLLWGACYEASVRIVFLLRGVTSCFHASTISWWQQNQRRRRQQGERQKSNMFILKQTQLNIFARASRYFVHFLPSLHHYDMKLPNFTSPLYGVGEHNTKIVTFFFLTYKTINTVPKKISPRFAKLYEIEREHAYSGI